MLTSILTVVLPAVVTGVVGVVRTNVAPLIPDKFVPAALAVAGGLVGAVGAAVGVEIPIVDLIQGPASVWESAAYGIVTALASVGVHQVFKQGAKRE